MWILWQRCTFLVETAELYSRWEQLDLISNFAAVNCFWFFFNYSGQLRVENVISALLKRCRLFNNAKAALGKLIHLILERVRSNQLDVMGLLFLTLDMALDATGEAPNRTRNVHTSNNQHPIITNKHQIMKEIIIK
jgi:hypothetical protein